MAPVQVCKKWRKGTCRNGEQCRYRHGNRAEELAVAAPLERTPAEKRNRRKFFAGREIMKDTRACLHTFEDLFPIQNSITGPIRIKDCSFITSYNWCNTNKPVIYVPGSPAKWKSPPLPHLVPKDNGQVFINQNSHRSPSASFDPFFKALLTMHPTFHMDNIDLVTDRNSIRKLLSFASGKVDQSWRIDVDLVGETMFFSRWELHQVLIITGARGSGYGHEFEKAFLHFDKQLKDSSGHHRVVRYDLGGINCLVRFEVDGCVDEGNGLDDLGDGDNQEPEDVLAWYSEEEEVQVIERGSLVDPSSILELKSRSGGLRMQQSIPQLWISQTQHLFIGRHKDGLVDAAPQRFDMRDYFSGWEGKNQEALRGLVGLVAKIGEVAKGVKGGKCALVCKMEEKPRILRIYERGGKGLFMPEGVKEWCWGRETGERM